MPDIFSGAGQGMEGHEPPPGAKAQGDTESLVEFDNETGELVIQLPARLAKYKNELEEDLYHEFFLANPDMATQGDITRFITEWLRKKTGESL